MSKLTTRIKMLQENALDAIQIQANEPPLFWARSWMASAGEPWYIVRRGRACADVLRNLTPVIDDGELIVGKFCQRALTADEQEELRVWNKYSNPAVPYAGGQSAHMAIDYDKLLRLGLCGVKAEIKNYRSLLDLDKTEDQERDAFYRACLITLDAMIDYARRYAEYAEMLAETEENQIRKAELLDIANVCRRVPEHSASTFREAVQATHFMTFCLCAGQRLSLFQIGRPDRYLLPFYKRDLAEGRITPDSAQELLDCLCILFNEYTPRGLAVGFMIGGRDAHGQDVSNDLTRMFLETIEHTKMAYPGIGLCWHREIPEELLRRSTELLAQGLSHPAIFNDEVITTGMMNAGLPPAEACLYINSTCVELTPIASSNVKIASPYFNLVQALHDVIGIGQINSPNPSFPTNLCSFDELKKFIRARLNEMVRNGIRGVNRDMLSRRYHGGYPLLSCFVNDCLRLGKDIDHGGARYNWIEPSFVGLANLADSLAAIRKFVFEEKSLTLNELVQALRENFDGKEELRQMLLNRSPKYGTDDDTVDSLAKEVFSWFVDECKKYRTYFDDTVHPGTFSWVIHEAFGRSTCASADGRQAGFPLSPASGPAQGREKKGPTAVIKSTTKWGQSPLLGGGAVNVKFSRSRTSDSFAENLVNLIETFMLRGGFEIQVNVVDRDTLLKAQADPEDYPDLVVRIAGYSDYFVHLSKEMQDEVIMRTEHEM